MHLHLGEARVGRAPALEAGGRWSEHRTQTSLIGSSSARRAPGSEPGGRRGGSGLPCHLVGFNVAVAKWERSGLQHRHEPARSRPATPIGAVAEAVF